MPLFWGLSDTPSVIAWRSWRRSEGVRRTWQLLDSIEDAQESWKVVSVVSVSFGRLMHVSH
jgi:hypothetical protein